MVAKRKKILFSAYSLEIGGIETALLSLLNYLSLENKYDITLVLEKKTGVLLNKINKSINIIEYTPVKKSCFSKIINLVNRVKFIVKYKNRFDFSCAYATYALPASFVARNASKNSALWVHSSYLEIFNKNEELYKAFFNKLHVNDFQNIIFVSNRSKNEFEKIMLKHNTVLCNNIIDFKKIKQLAKEKSKLHKDEKFTFLYVGRIIEESKCVSRLVEVAIKLKKDNNNFKIIVIGNGNQFENIKETVVNKKIDDCFVFLGEQQNPYPYYKIVDALILVSENEGYPVVFNEAKTLGLPIITTDVSDSKEDIDNKFGIVCNQNIEDIVKKCEYIIKNGFTSEISELKSFNPEKYNDNIKDIIEKIINEK